MKVMNGWNCLKIREICIVRRQNVLRVTTFFPPNVEAGLVSELQNVQDSMDLSERPHPVVNYSFTDDSDEESELPQSHEDTTDDEDIPSDDDHHQTGQISQQTLQSK